MSWFDRELKQVEDMIVDDEGIKPCFVGVFRGIVDVGFDFELFMQFRRGILNEGPWAGIENRPIAQSVPSFVLQQFGSQLHVGGMPMRLFLFLRHLRTSFADHRDEFYRNARTKELLAICLEYVT